MKIHRFYIKDKSYTLGAEVLKVEDKDILHQAYNVLRLKGGEQVSLFNGLDGFDYFYNIKDINKKEFFLSFAKKEYGITLGTELFPKVNVYISIIKSDFDKVIRELVEIGVDSISPIISEKTERKEVNGERFHKIITEAAEQSGRTILPKLSEVIKLKDLLERPDFILEKNKKNGEVPLSGDVSICYHTEVSQTKQGVTDIKDSETNDAREKIDSLNIFIGPEGGWSEGEVKIFEKMGFEIKKINTFVLKTSTAGVLCTYDAIKSFT